MNKRMSIKRSITAFLGAPFSPVLEYREGKIIGVQEEFRKKWQRLYEGLEAICDKVLSSHVAEDFGRQVPERELVNRDVQWMHECTVFVAYLPCNLSGQRIFSEGLMTELGAACALRKPTIIIQEPGDQVQPSYFIDNLDSLDHVVACSWQQILENASEALEQACEILEKKGNLLTRSISSADALLMKHIEIPVGALVLDLSASSGGFASWAVKKGAKSIVLADYKVSGSQTWEKTLHTHELDGKGKIVLLNSVDEIEGQFDVIVLNLSTLTFLSSAAADDALDLDYSYLVKGLLRAKQHLRTDGKLYVCLSENEELASILNTLPEAGFEMEAQWTHVCDVSRVNFLWRLSLSLRHGISPYQVQEI